jgi:hypothetical protein
MKQIKETPNLYRIQVFQVFPIYYALLKDNNDNICILIILIYIQCGNHLWNKFSNFKTNDICQKR